MAISKVDTYCSGLAGFSERVTDYLIACRLENVSRKIPHTGDTNSLDRDSDSSTDTIKSNPIRNTSGFLKLHAQTIHESNP